MKTKEQKRTFWILALIGLLYFCALIPFNLTGAETPDMLEVFEVDEYAQYPHLIRMLTPGDGLYQTVRNFFIYLHYYYGFPFYFWSAVSVLPVRLSGADWASHTRVIVCVLRQMLSALPMILSAGILTWITTRFRKPLTAVLLFTLLLTLPAVLQNDFWWHPDSLTLFFLCLTFFFLDRDRGRCGKNFLLAAAACGAAIGTKYLGLYFTLAVPAYLICCRVWNIITTKEMLRKAVLFVLVMAVFVLVSDPLLLLPQERAEILGIMKQQTVLSGTGIFLRYEDTFLENGHLPTWLTENYLRLPWLILSLAGLVCGICSKDRDKRVISIVTAVYLLTACTINLNAAAKRLHYFLPILLPLAAQLPNLAEIVPKSYQKTFGIVFTVILLAQTGLNIKTDVGLLETQLHREENSGSIALYHQLADQYLPLPEVPDERMTRIYRDWKAYFPEQIGYAVKTDWDLGSFALMEEWHPDLILLEKENIRAYSSEGALDQAVNPARMRQTVEFYAAAAEGDIPGYTLLCENEFGIVFRKDAE